MVELDGEEQFFDFVERNPPPSIKSMVIDFTPQDENTAIVNLNLFNEHQNQYGIRVQEVNTRNQYEIKIQEGNT